MSNLQISLKNIRSTVDVTIDGHKYTARKLGAGEELDAAAQSRRLFELIDELDVLAKNKLVSKNPEDIPAADKVKYQKLTKRLATITTDVEDIQIGQFNRSLRMLDDGEGGKKTRELLGSLTTAERNILFRQIFEPQVEDEPEAEAEKSKES